MIDITQSYNIFDSAMFQSCKLVEEKLDTNPEYDLLSKAPNIFI